MIRFVDAHKRLELSAVFQDYHIPFLVAFESFGWVMDELQGHWYEDRV